MTVDELEDEYGLHGEHPEFSRETWKAEVACDCCQNGYWQWVAGEVAVSASLLVSSSGWRPSL